MTAIETYWIPCTNNRPNRIVARASKFRIVITQPDELTNEAAHFVAVEALLAKHKLDWTGQLAVGTLENGHHVWVWVDARGYHGNVWNVPGGLPEPE